MYLKLYWLHSFISRKKTKPKLGFSTVDLIVKLVLCGLVRNLFALKFKFISVEPKKNFLVSLARSVPHRRRFHLYIVNVCVIESGGSGSVELKIDKHCTVSVPPSLDNLILLCKSHSISVEVNWFTVVLYEYTNAHTSIVDSLLKLDGTFFKTISSNIAKSMLGIFSQYVSSDPVLRLNQYKPYCKLHEHVLSLLSKHPFTQAFLSHLPHGSSCSVNEGSKYWSLKHLPLLDSYSWKFLIQRALTPEGNDNAPTVHWFPPDKENTIGSSRPNFILP